MLIHQNANKMIFLKLWIREIRFKASILTAFSEWPFTFIGKWIHSAKSASFTENKFHTFSGVSFFSFTSCNCGKLRHAVVNCGGMWPIAQQDAVLLLECFDSALQMPSFIFRLIILKFTCCYFYRPGFIKFKFFICWGFEGDLRWW